MAFGSINIFKFLWNKKVQYSRNSLKYSIIGGNPEIIHILEEEKSLDIAFNDECILISIQYYRPSITAYLIDLVEWNGMPKYQRFHSISNFQSLYKWICFLSTQSQTIQEENIKYFLNRGGLETYLFYYCFYTSERIDSSNNVWASFSRFICAFMGNFSN